MSAPGRPWRREAEGLSLRVRLTPKSSRDAIEGVCETGEGPALKARVRAVPERGQANAALEELVARALGVPRRCVRVAAGETSRLKRLTIAGDAVAIEASLVGLLEG